MRKSNETPQQNVSILMSFIDRHVLLLNSDKEVLDVITWQDAIGLIFKERVMIHEHFEDSVIHSARSEMKMPKVIILCNYVAAGYKSSKRYIKLNKRNVLLRDNHTCMYCGRALTDFTGTIDHVIPVSKKGKNSWDNVVAACGKCNKRKDNKRLEDTDMKLLRRPFVPSKHIFYGKFLKKPEYESWRQYINKKEA